MKKYNLFKLFICIILVLIYTGCAKSSSYPRVAFFGGSETQGYLYTYNLVTKETLPVAPSHQLITPYYLFPLSWNEHCQCFVYTAGYAESAELYLLLPGKPPQRLTHNNWEDSSPQWSPTGQWLAFLSRQGDGKQRAYLMEYPAGDIRPLVSDRNLLADELRWSPDGGKMLLLGAYSQEQVWPPQSELFVVDVRTGAILYRLKEDGVIDKPSWSPSGDRIAYVLHTGQKHVLKIWEIQVNRSFTLFSEQDVWFAEWSPDGEHIAVLAGILERHNPVVRLYTIRTDGAELRDLTPAGAKAVTARPGLWSPDGACLLITVLEHTGKWSVYIIHHSSGKAMKISEEYPFAISLLWAVSSNFSCRLN